MDLVLDKRVMDNILEVKNFNAEAKELLNLLIDKELEKEDNEIDFEFIDECSDAIVEIELNAENTSRVIFPLLSSRRFLSRAGAVGFKSLSRSARVMLVAAVILATTITANAAVGSITGTTIFRSIVSTLSADDEEEEVTTTTPAEREEYEVVDDGVSEPEDEEDDEEPPYTGIPEGESTTLGYKAVYTPNDSELREIEKKDKESGTTRKSDGTDEFTGYDDETTQKEEETTPAPVLKDIKLITINNVFKTEYEIGEKFSFEGLYINAYYDDGSLQSVDINDCKISGFDTATAGTKTVTVTYKGKSKTVRVNVKEKTEESTSEEEKGE